jgi:hypothetical protein
MKLFKYIQIDNDDFKKILQQIVSKKYPNEIIKNTQIHLNNDVNFGTDDIRYIEITLDTEKE